MVMTMSELAKSETGVFELKISVVCDEIDDYDFKSQFAPLLADYSPYKVVWSGPAEDYGTVVPSDGTWILHIIASGPDPKDALRKLVHDASEAEDDFFCEHQVEFLAAGRGGSGIAFWGIVTDDADIAFEDYEGPTDVPGMCVALDLVVLNQTGYFSAEDLGTEKGIELAISPRAYHNFIQIEDMLQELTVNGITFTDEVLVVPEPDHDAYIEIHDRSSGDFTVARRKWTDVSSVFT